MALGTVYTVSEARRCMGCSNDLPADAAGQRRLCDRCRARRRALSYLRAAASQLSAASLLGLQGDCERLLGAVELVDARNAAQR